ncbi:hypothetical protein BH10ACI2_BH10ACI2_17740 [soil metagenome]
MLTNGHPKKNYPRHWMKYAHEELRHAIRSYRERKFANSIFRRNSNLIEGLRRSDLPLKLELGSGPRGGENGWTTVDMGDGPDLSIDLRTSLPFAENEIAEIYSSHFLEHFDYRDLIKLLEECYRVLQPDGVFRAAVPNARIYINGYLNENEFDIEFYCRYEPAFQNNSKIDVLNYIAYMDGHHRHMFDEENIIDILELVGFRDVALRKFDPDLDLKERDYESIYVGGIK